MAGYSNTVFIELDNELITLKVEYQNDYLITTMTKGFFRKDIGNAFIIENEDELIVFQIHTNKVTHYSTTPHLR